MKQIRHHTLSLLRAATLALPLLPAVLTARGASAQTFDDSTLIRVLPAPASSAGKPLPALPAPYWSEGAYFLGLAPDADDSIWALDVRGDAIYVAGDRGPALGGDKLMFVAKFKTDGRTSLQLDPSFGT